jgi:hypothetical protein
MPSPHSIAFYQKSYDALILRGKSRPSPKIKERHHIKPRSLGGSNRVDNLVDLTPREHFIAHLILLRITSGSDRSKMARAMWRLIKRAPTSRLYDMACRLAAAASTGTHNHAFGKKWWHDPVTNKAVLSHDCPHGFVKGLAFQRGGFPKGHIWINDGNRESMASPKDSVPYGWKIGRLVTPDLNHLKNMSSLRHTLHNDSEHSKKMSGRVCLGKGNEFKRVHPDKVELYLSNGWSIRSNPTKSTRPVMVEGIEYDSIAHAARSLRIANPTAHYRFGSSSKKWINWVYVYTLLNKS